MVYLKRRFAFFLRHIGSLVVQVVIYDEDGAIVTVDSEGQVQNEREGLEYLVPPLLPFFQY